MAITDGGRMRWTVAAAEAGIRIDAWLAARQEVGSRARAREWVERGKVFVNGHEVTFATAGRRVSAGDEVVVWVDRPGSARRQPREVVSRRDALRIIFEDAAIVVADKPAGVLVEPLPGDHSEVTLCDLLADRLRGSAERPLVVHRIDRDTTGLVLFAKHAGAQAALKRQFERRTARRVYLAVVAGCLKEREGTWTDGLVWDKVRLIQRKARPGDEPTIVKQAVASYRVLEQFAEAALLEVRLQTGKRNQIRIQAALRRHALVGERIYSRERGGPVFARQALHAVSLAFRHPTAGKDVEFDSPVPEDMQRLIERLRRAP